MWNRDRLYIGGKWVAPAMAGTIEVISPSTEQTVGQVPDGVAADVDRAVEAARAAFDTGPWPRMSAGERAAVLEEIAALLGRRADEITEVISSSAGFPVAQTRLAQIALPQASLRYYADLIRSTPLENLRDGVLRPLHVRHSPLGVVGAIVPWNIPLLGAIATLSPVWAAGCASVLKPSPETPLDAFLLAEITEEAGMPAGVFNVVPGGGEAGARLVEHPGVDKIAFTGSTATGKRIAATCARFVKPCALELGGNAASVILDDAPADQVAAGIARSAFVVNSGQACVAQTRIVVLQTRAAEITDALVAAAQRITVGDPFAEGTMIGPLISSTHRDHVRELVEIGRGEGAKLLTGGAAPADPDRGWYFSPTVFGDVRNDMQIARQEVFGPVATVIPVADEEEALAVANDTEYGLSGSVWSADVDRATAFGRRIQAGSIWINDTFALDPAAPFGGWKASGLGRQGGPEGLYEYLQTQTLYRPDAV